MTPRSTQHNLRDGAFGDAKAVGQRLLPPSISMQRAYFDDSGFRKNGIGIGLTPRDSLGVSPCPVLVTPSKGFRMKPRSISVASRKGFRVEPRSIGVSSRNRLGFGVRPVSVPSWVQTKSNGMTGVFQRSDVLKVRNVVPGFYTVAMVDMESVRPWPNEARNDENMNTGSPHLPPLRRLDIEVDSKIPAAIEPWDQQSPGLRSLALGGPPHTAAVRNFVVRESGALAPFFSQKLLRGDRIDSHLGLLHRLGGLRPGRGSRLGSGSSTTLSHPVVGRRSSGVRD